MESGERICSECGKSKPLTSFQGEGDVVHDRCYRCRIAGVNLGKPSDFPTRTRRRQGLKKGTNSYEKGIPTDERGMPYLGGPDLHPMGQKEVNANRHLIEETRRRRRQEPLPPTPREVVL